MGAISEASPAWATLARVTIWNDCRAAALLGRGGCCNAALREPQPDLKIKPMTFAIVLGNTDQIIQASDRRLTAANGDLVDDAANKAGHVLCDDATFLYCFTGLARVGNAHITSRWILDALSEAAESGHSYYDLVRYFADISTRFFARSKFLQRLSPNARRLTVMFTGYRADGHILNSLISNFQGFGTYMDNAEAHPAFTFLTFKSTYSAAERNPTLIQAIGQFGALMPDDEAQLRVMLERRAPTEALRQKAVSLIQDISDRPRARGTVGKKVTTARLRRSHPFAPVVGFGSNEAERALPLLNQVYLMTGSPGIRIADAQITTQTAAFLPRVHRNAPCPCGSGQRYRLCHGQKPAAR